MKKVIVIGCPGSGKTVFSQKLAQKTGLPLIHLDALYHQKIWSADADRKKEEWVARVGELLAGEEWVIDGNYKSTLAMRAEAADTIVFLDYPGWISLLRTFRRRFQFHGRQRPDMPSGWKEKISLEFLVFIWRYRTAQRPKVHAVLHGQHAQKRIHNFRHPREAEAFLTMV